MQSQFDRACIGTRSAGLLTVTVAVTGGRVSPLGEEHHMLKKTIRTLTVTTAAAATVAVLAGGAFASAGKPALGGPHTAPEGSPLAAAAKAFRSAYPSMTQAAAEKAARGQDARKELQTVLVSGASAKTFGGSWYDAPSGTFHVAATTGAARAAATASARRLGVSITTHAVSHSFAELEVQAAALRAGSSELGKAAAGNVGIDVVHNAVVASVPPARFATLSRAKASSVAVVAAKPTSVEEDAGCTARNACDYTIKAGSMLWTGSAGNNVCSVGFTARQTNNARWVYTAGHCSGGNGLTWGTGALPIGPMYASINSGVYDASIIQVTNSWFAGDQGGEIYKAVNVNGVAPTLSYMVQGETVCLSANYTAADRRQLLWGHRQHQRRGHPRHGPGRRPRRLRRRQWRWLVLAVQHGPPDRLRPAQPQQHRLPRRPGRQHFLVQPAADGEDQLGPVARRRGASLT